MAMQVCLITFVFLLLSVAGGLGCGTPPSVSHAKVATSTVNSLEIATYTCDSANGYATRGNNTIACLRLHGYAVWTSVDVRCERMQCRNTPSMNHATHDFLETKTKSRTRSQYYGGRRYRYRYRSGHTSYYTQYYSTTQARTVYYTGHVTFTCTSNYFLPNETQTVRTYCGDHGRWITPDALCQGRNCGVLPTMEGVTCSGVSIRYPARRSCRCDTGYERTNSRSFIRSCLPSGSWSSPTDSRPALCTRVICGQPPAIANSNHRNTNITGTRYQDKATYTCLPGYEVKGGSYDVTCQANRRWATLPACTRKDCGKPPTIDNGRIPRHLYNTTFDTEVKYSCSSIGYSMVGSAAIRCSEDGTWSTPPICHKVNCGPPAIVPHSRRTVFGHSYTDNVTYECDVGYRLTGNSSIYCQVIGHWTIPPSCHSSSCEEPPEVENALNISSTSGTYVGDKIRYTCLSGYKMSGYSIAECLPSLQWSALPFCNRIRCGNPPSIQNGIRHVRGHYLNDTAEYGCHIGYLMSGNAVVHCQSDGHWSTPPECNVISCGVPPTSQYAHIRSMSGFQLGNTVTYQCLPGYFTTGPNFITCQVNATWSKAPHCSNNGSGTVSSCGVPPVARYAHISSMNGFKRGDTITYECLLGYTALGPKFVTCQSDGTWSTPPNCIQNIDTTTVPPSSCEEPPEVENALNISSTSGTSVGDKISYRCQSGYKMSGYSIAECLSSLQWSALPYCNRIRCGNPPSKQNSIRHVRGHYLNDITAYKCHLGYLMSGNAVSRCQSDGHWSTPPECNAVSCGEPPVIENAYKRSMDGVQFGNTITYQCTAGFLPSDPQYITCQADETWSTLPHCEWRMTTTESVVTYSSSRVETTIFNKITFTSPTIKKQNPTMATTPFSELTTKPHELLTQQTARLMTEATTKLMQKTTKRFEARSSTLPREMTSSTTHPFKVTTKTSSTRSMRPRQSVPATTSFPTTTLGLRVAAHTVPYKAIPNSTKIAVRHRYEYTSALPSVKPLVVIVKTGQNNSHLGNTTLIHAPLNLPNMTNKELEGMERMHTKTKAAEHKTGSSGKKGADAGLIVACTMASVAFISLTLLAWKLVKKFRTRGEHHFVPVSNALYEADGQVMTIYSFKENTSDIPR